MVLQNNYNSNITKTKNKVTKKPTGNFLAVQWLVLCAFTAEGPGSMHGQKTRISQAAWHRQKKKKPVTSKITNHRSHKKYNNNEKV